MARTTFFDSTVTLRANSVQPNKLQFEFILSSDYDWIDLILEKRDAVNWRVSIDGTEYNMTTDYNSYGAFIIYTENNGVLFEVDGPQLHDTYDDSDFRGFYITINNAVEPMTSMTAGPHAFVLSADPIFVSKFTFGTHKTGTSIADGIFNELATNDPSYESKTGSIFENVLYKELQVDLVPNIAHNIRDAAAVNGNDMAWVKGEYVFSTGEKGDGDWHPDEPDEPNESSEEVVDP